MDSGSIRVVFVSPPPYGPKKNWKKLQTILFCDAILTIFENYILVDYIGQVNFTFVKKGL